jgi:hypothetical protein
LQAHLNRLRLAVLVGSGGGNRWQMFSRSDLGSTNNLAFSYNLVLCIISGVSGKDKRRKRLLYKSVQYRIKYSFFCNNVPNLLILISIINFCGSPFFHALTASLEEYLPEGDFAFKAKPGIMGNKRGD